MTVIGVTGASGQLGRLVVQQLKAKHSADSIVALARDTSKISDNGVTNRQADYSNYDSLVTGLKGVDTLILISSSEVGSRSLHHNNVLKAAKSAGVKRIVYTSLLHADKSTINLAGEHRETEAALRASGIPFTILRNGWYTENYKDSIAGAVGHGALIGSAGEGKISSASRLDYADAAVVAATTEGHEGKIYELAGDNSYTLTELAAEISKQTGKTIPYKNLPESDYAAALLGAGLPKMWADMFASWDPEIEKGVIFDESHELSRLIGRSTTPMSVTVASLLPKSS